MTLQNTAAIDLGTNSCRLLIVDAQGNTLYKNAISTRMGEGMSAHNRFTDEAIKRGVECFCSFKMLMDQYKVDKYRAIATAACRMAENGAYFVDLIKRQANIELEVIDAYEEARLNLLGGMLNVQNETCKYAVVYDLGGGSTEISLATRSLTPEILHTISIPWGARNSSEKFNLVDYDQEKAAKLADEISGYVRKFVKDAKLSDYAGDVCFIATSSTPLRLAHIAEGWTPYKRDRADGMKIAAKEFDKAVSLVQAMSSEERMLHSSIGPSRADIFNSACVIFSQIYRDLGAGELVASLKSAVDGIVMELQNGN
uniref:Ppx/GppA phosphatase N-terminal domain-containing protein n=1 Tax=uncultured Alphaproteobacteria bacterium TaxID=91750 RepID=A0A6G8F3B5_9PROT|nr:hypothetical protein PlAlph_6160 [uncultured Alphaproteobacteria bacterium]